MSLETVIARQQRRVEVAGITKSQQVMASGINLLGDGATQSFTAAAATRATTSTKSRIPRPCVTPVASPATSTTTSPKSRIPLPSVTRVASPATTKRAAKRKSSAITEPWRTVVQQLLEKVHSFAGSICFVLSTLRAKATHWEATIVYKCPLLISHSLDQRRGRGLR